jgi:hypothetical protein
MKLVEAFLKDELFIDFSAEVMYGEDQMCLDYLHRFATVGFQLMATSGLAQIADRIRKDQGFKPMHPMDEYTDETCDQNGWYDFFIGLNDWSNSKVDSCIDVIVVNSDSPDNEECYTIDLDGKEQEYVYARLDEQCRKYLGKSCEELLAEARKLMEEDAP